jgi:BCD family chlorophyll transporter-like MFS transporter
MVRLLAVIALGTAGFGMADVLMEPFGGQVLAMTVAQTTRLTVYLAAGNLLGFALASRVLSRGALPLNVAIYGALIGVPALGFYVVSAQLASALILTLATLAAGFGSGLFGHGTLTATMRSAPREQIGLSLGAWGAVQATSAGLSFALGGVMRDVVLSHSAVGASSAEAYTPIFILEIGLLVLALLLALPMFGRARVQPIEPQTAQDRFAEGNAS